MITVQNYIDSRAPAYSSDTRIAGLTAQASLETGTVFIGDLRNKAITLLILHWMTVDDRDTDGGSAGIGGTVKREREGQLEREYMLDFSLTANFPDLSQSKWGLELIRLRRQCIMAPRNRFTV